MAKSPELVAVISRPAVAIAVWLSLILGLTATLGWASTDVPATDPIPRLGEFPRLGVPDSARGVGGVSEGRGRVAARLLIHPGSSETVYRVGVLFDVDPGWHIYWRNPGESGLPTVLDWWALGSDVGPIHWPAPRSHAESDGLFTTYGYSDQVLLTNDLRFSEPPRLDAELVVDVRVLVCKIECLPAEMRLSRSFGSVADAVTEPRWDAIRDLFAHSASRVPQPPRLAGLDMAVLYSTTAVRPGDDFRVGIRISCSDPAVMGGRDCEDWLQTIASAEFFDRDGSWLELDSGELIRDPSNPSAVAVELSGLDISGDTRSIRERSRLLGVLAFSDGPGNPRVAIQVDVPFPASAAGAKASDLGTAWLQREVLNSAVAGRAAEPSPGLQGNPPDIGILHAALLAILGGLILNLMPCVLPVLAIKIFAVAEMAERSRREVLGHGIAYTTGILATLLALAVTVLALRAGGTLVGWGFQFQEPLFIAIVTTVVVMFAVNLFGIYEIQVHAGSLANLGRQATGYRRSFFDGLLGVVLATPCSAPFLGTAVGFAFASSAPVIIAIFLCIGLGLAMPLTVISVLPGAARWLPRPGAWMLKLRTGLGFALLATAVWLLSVFGSSVGLEALITLIGFLVAVTFALWLFGMAQSSGRVKWVRAAAVAVVLLLASGPGVVTLEPAGSQKLQARSESIWLPYDPSSVAMELREGHPVFVFFTAEWCLTCKVNERLVLTHDSIESELEKLGIVTFKADWTHRDDAIRTELARFGKAGVPLYLVYDPLQPEAPVMLPELLTVDLLREALRSASHGNS